MSRQPRQSRNSPSAETDWQGVIERLGWGGKGIGRLADNRIVLLDAPLALFPGEVVHARIREKKRHAEGYVTEWIVRDPRRAAAPCPVAELCGGCSLWEGGDATAELNLAMVRDLLDRQLPAAPDVTWLPAPTDAIRHRIQLHWDGIRLGFHQQRSNAPVPVTDCPVAAPKLAAAIEPLRHALYSGDLPIEEDRWELATGTPAGDIAATADSDPDHAWRLKEGSWVRDNSPLVHNLSGHKLMQLPGGFFQACPQWAWAAMSDVLGGWDLSGSTLYDLYSGGGFFSRMLSESFERFVLVESAPLSIAAAMINLAPEQMSPGCKVEIIRAEVESWLPEAPGAPGETILADPPRTGLPPDVTKRLLTAQADTLVLVGCDGMAFCRDVKRLEEGQRAEKGQSLEKSWRLDSLAAIDLFPNTPLVEFVGLMRR